jgi:hypothetical protein
LYRDEGIHGYVALADGVLKSHNRARVRLAGRNFRDDVVRVALVQHHVGPQIFSQTRLARSQSPRLVLLIGADEINIVQLSPA